MPVSVPRSLTFTDINNATGFANGDRFTSDEQVREYFTTENMELMFPGDEHPDPDELAEMADAVIENRWHRDDFEGGE